jgi:hypothetical protein
MASVTKKPAAGRRGRRLTRMNLLVDRGDIEKLKKLYGVKSASEAMRKAAALVLLGEEAEKLAEWTAAHGGLDDVYGRTTGANALPHEWPEGEHIQDLEMEEEKPAAAAARRR